MRKAMFGFALAAALVLSAAAVAEEVSTRVQGAGAGGSKPKADGDKGTETRAAGEAKAGTLAPKPADAPEGVLAVLKAKAAEESRPRRTIGARSAPKEETFNMMASGAEVAVKIKELAAKESYVELTGIINGDTIRVTSIKEAPKPPEPDRKKSSRR